MSASVAQISTASSSQSQTWLPLPSGLGLDDSFSQDLIRQFDRRRSRLRAELEQRRSIHYQPHTSSSASISDASEHNSQPGTPEQQTPPEEAPARSLADDDPTSTQARRRSAGDLLRRSSAFLRAKFEAFKAMRPDTAPPSMPSTRPMAPAEASSSAREQSNNNDDDGEEEHRSRRSLSSHRKKRHHAYDIFGSSSSSLPQPSKIAINTTISIPQFVGRQEYPQRPMHYAANIQPPVITQYPPKPLKYSPVEPLSDASVSHANKRKTMHRISLPVLNRAEKKQPKDAVVTERRLSDSNILDRQHPAAAATTERNSSHHSLGSIGQKAKKWTRAMGCRPSKKSRKGKDRATNAAVVETT